MADWKLTLPSSWLRNIFFPWMKTFIKHWVLELTVLVLVLRLFYFIFWAISAHSAAVNSVDTSPYTGIWSLQDAYLPAAGALSHWAPVPQCLWPDFLLIVCWVFLHFPPSMIMEQISGYLAASLDQKGQACRIHPCLTYKHFVLEK